MPAAVSHFNGPAAKELGKLHYPEALLVELVGIIFMDMRILWAYDIWGYLASF